MTSLVSELFKQTCRTCLSTKGEMVSIFSSGFYVSQLPKKLMAFTRLEISENDGLPKVICKKCLFLAESVYCFKEQCESADNQLKSLLKNKLNNKDTVLAGRSPDSLISDSGSCCLGVTDSFGRLPNLILSNESQQHNKRNAFVQPREIEDDYAVEYISDEVRIEVENAMKRRQEAERRISMEKVSQTVRNLEGIEVVPVTDLCTARQDKSSDRKKEDIVVFPVTIPRKRSKSIETMVIDDPLPLNKRLRLPAETSFTKVDLTKGRQGDSTSTCSILKKMNFSTVKKFVKIKEEECGGKDHPQMRNHTNIIIISDDDNEVVDTQIGQNSKNRKDAEILKNISQEQDMNLNAIKVEGEPKVDKSKPESESTQKSEVININEIYKLASISADIDSSDCESEEEVGEKYSVCRSETLETMLTFTMEYEEQQAHEFSNDFQSYYLVADSTVGSIISETDDYDYGNDKRSAQIFVKNKFSGTNNNCSFSVEKKEIENNDSNMNCFVESETNQRRTYICSLDRFSHDATSSVLLGIDSSNTQKMDRQEAWIDDIQDYSLSSVADSPTLPDQPIRDTKPEFYQCTTCLMQFDSLPGVLKHNVQEHMSDEVPFACFICEESFDDKGELYNHVDEHNGSKPFKCSFCPKTFSMQRKLKRHIDYHINYKSFVCEVCKKRFTKKPSLESHMYLHIKKAPFTCKSCNISFNEKTSWQRHVATIHEKLKTVVCEFYKMELPDNRSPQVHTTPNTGDKPDPCLHRVRDVEIESPDNPLVERVMAENQRRVAGNTDGFRENKLNSEKKIGENGAALYSAIEVNCTKVEIDTKENNSLSCNAPVVGNAEKKYNGQSWSQIKVEHCGNNGGGSEQFTT